MITSLLFALTSFLLTVIGVLTTSAPVILLALAFGLLAGGWWLGTLVYAEGGMEDGSSTGLR
jgi:hypothetical protein